MSAPAPTVCRTCDGEAFVVVEQRGTDVELPCPACSLCEFCGEPTSTPPECLVCAVEDDMRFRRRVDV